MRSTTEAAKPLSSRAAAGEVAGRPRRVLGDQVPLRKVRAPQGRVVGNTDPGRPAGKCHRK